MDKLKADTAPEPRSPHLGGRAAPFDADNNTIAGFTQGDLRRFIINLLQSDPGAVPRVVREDHKELPTQVSDGDVPVWNTATQQWVASSQFDGPWRDISYNSFEGDKSVTATSEETADVVVTASAFTSSGSPVMIEFFAPWMSHDTADGAIVLVLYQDGSSIGFLSGWDCYASGKRIGPVYAARRMSPAVGSRTYSIRAFTASGTGTIMAGGGGSGVYSPGFVRISQA